jgi:hypothetical protein
MSEDLRVILAAQKFSGDVSDQRVMLVAQGIMRDTLRLTQAAQLSDHCSSPGASFSGDISS